MRCRHCYDDIRQATVSEFTTASLLYAEPSTYWLNAEDRSPFCLDTPCASTGESHRIRHEPMPQV